MTNEQRDYFRIKDKAFLQLIAVDEHTATSNLIPTEFTAAPGYALISELNLIDKDGSLLLKAIAEQNRDIEAYLKLINKKIDCIASHFIAQHQEDDEKSLIDITLSEGGLSFHDKTARKTDSYTAIKLTLQPTQKNIVAFAKVTNCKPTAGGEFLIVVSFVNLKEPIRQQIAKHVLQFQLTQKRQAQEQQMQ